MAAAGAARKITAPVTSWGLHSAACLRWHIGPTRPIAAPLEQNNIVPDVVDVAEALAAPDLAKTASTMQGEARVVMRQDLRLQCPESIGFGNGNQRAQQRSTDTLATCLRADIDADLSDTRRSSRVRNRGECRPAKDAFVVLAGDDPAEGQMPGIPVLPNRRD